MQDYRNQRLRTWRLPLAVSVVALALAFFEAIWSPNFGSVVEALLIIPVASLILVILTARRRGRQLAITMAVLVVYGLFSCALDKYSDETRFEARWIIGSKGFKAQVLAQPAPSTGTLRHIEWDGWGWGSIDTNVYLVFNPNDSLRGYSPEHLNGLPCKVWKVMRLEKDWYAVTFYTEAGWDYCNS